mmetsp:Transcript_14563/g.47813  ORF Transcript_14563/g.47813 Transcript_14563/m.47813 type:complete len:469 (+) Transcript_14563:184-1590(+)
MNLCYYIWMTTKYKGVSLSLVSKGDSCIDPSNLALSEKGGDVVEDSFASRAAEPTAVPAGPEEGENLLRHPDVREPHRELVPVAERRPRHVEHLPFAGALRVDAGHARRADGVDDGGDVQLRAFAVEGGDDDVAGDCAAADAADATSHTLAVAGPDQHVRVVRTPDGAAEVWMVRRLRNVDRRPSAKFLHVIHAHLVDVRVDVIHAVLELRHGLDELERHLLHLLPVLHSHDGVDARGVERKPAVVVPECNHLFERRTLAVVLKAIVVERVEHKGADEIHHGCGDAHEHERGHDCREGHERVRGADQAPSLKVDFNAVELPDREKPVKVFGRAHRVDAVPDRVPRTERRERRRQDGLRLKVERVLAPKVFPREGELDASAREAKDGPFVPLLRVVVAAAIRVLHIEVEVDGGEERLELDARRQRPVKPDLPGRRFDEDTLRLARRAPTRRVNGVEGEDYILNVRDVIV